MNVTEIIIIAALILLVSIVLSSNSNNITEKEKTEKVKESKKDKHSNQPKKISKTKIKDVFIYVDPKTKCHYLWTGSFRAGLTPRLNSHNNIICEK